MARGHVCRGGGHVGQDRRLQQQTVCILLKCILGLIYYLKAVHYLCINGNHSCV